MNVHKDDMVLIISGRREDKGKRARVRQVLPDKNKVIVEGVNVHRKHTRGRAGARQAGIVEIEAPMDASKVMVVCQKCNQPTRIGHTFLADGSKVRQCRKCGELIINETDRRWMDRRGEG
jgi:large subunit ribosomal protein L24